MAIKKSSRGLTTGVVIGTIIGIIILLLLKSAIVFGLLCLLEWLLVKVGAFAEFNILVPFAGLVIYWIISFTLPSGKNKGGN